MRFVAVVACAWLAVACGGAVERLRASEGGAGHGGLEATAGAVTAPAGGVQEATGGAAGGQVPATGGALTGGAGPGGAPGTTCRDGLIQRCYCELTPIGYAYQRCEAGTWGACDCEPPPVGVDPQCLTLGYRLCNCGAENGVQWCTEGGTSWGACECPEVPGSAGAAGTSAT